MPASLMRNLQLREKNVLTPNGDDDCSPSKSTRRNLQNILELSISNLQTPGKSPYPMRPCHSMVTHHE